MVENGLNRFLVKHKENADMNQYWYSKPTIEFMARQVEQFCAVTEEEKEAKKCAFMSTPSIYYSLKDKAVKAASKCMDVSKSFKCTYYDSMTKRSTKIPTSCSMILINLKISPLSCIINSIWLSLIHLLSHEKSGRNTRLPPNCCLNKEDIVC